MRVIENRLAFLCAVRDALDERGWAQGDYETVDRRICLLGAGSLALGHDEADDTTHDEEDEVARALGFQSEAEVVTWNDDRDRVVTDVHALLDGLINAAAGQQSLPLFLADSDAAEPAPIAPAPLLELCEACL